MQHFKQKYCHALKGLSLVLLSYGQANATDFDMSWTNMDWTVNAVGPATLTVTDTNGFQLDLRITIARIGGTALNGYPDDRTGFGTQESLWVVWNPSFGNGNVGDSTNTVTIEFLQNGIALPLDVLNFEVSDIDAVDNNATTDRCDFVTFNGNAGIPNLDYKEPNAALRSVNIGPGTGSGATGPLAANEAQCIYNTGTPGSPNSNGDDNGTIIADYPAGTHTVTIAYDESLSDVINDNDIDPAARGGGFFAGAVATSNASISLEKSTTATSFTNAGDTILYTYTITNDGPLVINTGQNIQIQDDKIGTFTCGTIGSEIAVNGTHSCTASYTVTAADLSNGGVTNIAIAGVGTGAQSFADRLQSNSDTVTVPAIVNPNLVGAKTVTVWDPDNEGLYALPGSDLIYTISATNDGDAAIDAGSIFIVDIMPSQVEFYNGDIDDLGPETEPVSFTQTSGAGLSFTYANDVGYSDSTIRPVDFSECNYSPAIGYDSLVKFVCFNPKGTMASGTPFPSFSVSMRTRLK